VCDAWGEVVSLLDEARNTEPSKASTLGKVADLLERNGIDVDDIGRVQRMNLWQMGYVNKDTGEAEAIDLVGVQLMPGWADGPAWPVVQAAAPVIAKPRPAPKAERTTRTIVVAPDPQIGYRRYEDGTLDPFHDEAAMALVLQIIRDAKPDAIVNLGDTCDFPEWSSKFLVSPEFVMTTQPTLDRVHRFLAEQITEAPEGCEVHMLEGNHDNRLGIAITKNAMAALRLRQANAPESWPVLSLQSLLRLDDLGVTYHQGYPAGRVALVVGDAQVVEPQE
jgi:hypothetical protein